MLVILNKKNKIRTADDIDEIIRAEIPDDSEVELQKIILNHMIHGPCEGSSHRALKFACRDKPNKREPEKCQKGFPKEFKDMTEMKDDGFPTYRRRERTLESYSEETQKMLIKYSKNENGEVEKDIVDNRYIVPYNKHLSLTFNCHLNVEYCGTIGAIKYLYKYIFKGSDRGTVVLDSSKNVNEITDYIDGRYIGANEALWRIMFDIYGGKSPCVMRLPYHLENEQLIRYDPDGEDIETKMETLKKTQFTEWMKNNKVEYNLVQKLNVLKQQPVLDEQKITEIQSKLPKKKI